MYGKSKFILFLFKLYDKFHQNFYNMSSISGLKRWFSALFVIGVLNYTFL
jgi:hypothetical protein